MVMHGALRGGIARGLARGDQSGVYVIGRNYQAARIGVAEAAGLIARLAGEGKPTLDGLITTWMDQ